LHDERLDKTHDFTSKNDVLEKEILLPDGAPEWMKDREALWNAVEKKENRKDAQSAREINIALPKELNKKQNWELARDFVNQEFVSKGMVADLTFHAGGSKEESQPHIHIMLTMREVNEEGFGQKVRSWNDKELLKSWREHWGERCNVELARHGFDIQIDHRSLDAQGIDLEPQSKIGAKSAQIKMARLVEHQELAERNGERLKANPEIALEAITRQQSTFTHQDLARFVNRHTKDETQFTEVYDLVKASAEIVYLGKDDANRERYTTNTMLTMETEMLATANKLNTTHQHIVPEQHQKAALENRTLSEEQLEAFNHLVGNKDLVCVIGYAGTGKSYVLGAARDAWERSDLRVTGATLSGIAAENLESGSGIKSYTVANRLWHWERGNHRLTDKDVLVIDEVGMLGSRQMTAVLAEVAKAKAKVAIVGDFEQLQAIEAGAAGRAIAEEVGYVTLSDIRRQIEPWQKAATKDFAENRTKEGLLAYEKHDNIHKFITKAEAIKNMVEQWDEVHSQSPEKSQIMLAYTKAEVKDLNDYARSLCRKHGELGEDFGVKTARGIREFAVGDRVYFLRNENHTLHVKNGTLGTIKELDGTNFTIKLDAPNIKQQDAVQFSVKDYRDIEHGYAATIHKAQGITVDRAHVLASKYFDKHTTYVAMSRHKDGADLYYAREEFAGFHELTRVLGRDGAKDVTLDYAQNRNIELNETKSLQINQFEQQERYSAVLNQERMQQAEQRLLARQYDNNLRQGLSELTKKHDLNFSLEIKTGEKGSYIGLVELAGKKYGVLQQEERTAKLIPADCLESKVMHKEVTIEKAHDKKGNEYLRGFQQEIRAQEQQMALERNLDRGGFER
jgi:Ti-type conjugative transfer relaxase TraA